jgi:Ca2+-binding EF-hand superfamily protein
MSSKKGHTASHNRRLSQQTSSHAAHDFSKIPKNSKGGVLVTNAEIHAAFEFFDLDRSGQITLSNLKKRLGVFYKNMPNKEFRFLMNNASSMNIDDLRELLVDNEVQNFDPVAEAFKVYDPHSTGYVDTEILRNVFMNLGFGDISDEDLEILIETGDGDKDGKISLNDFRNMLPFEQGEGEGDAAP